MSNEIEGCDISHWNGKAGVNIDFKKMWDAGVRFIYVKCSQGTSYQDDCFAVNALAAKSVGMKVGAYHFVTTANAIKQYEWFMKCMGSFQFDLTPALDCEAYTDTAYSSVMRAIGREREVCPVRPQMYTTNPCRPIAYDPYSNKLGYSLPSESTVDVIATRLKGFQGFKVPAIYTNSGFGDVIFKSPNMAQYLLWLANWGVVKPKVPNVWKNEKIYVWQDNVVDGIPYGLRSGKIDHNIWMTAVPFPSGETPPPPEEEPIPEKITGKLYVTCGDGVYVGEFDMKKIG